MVRGVKEVTQLEKRVERVEKYLTELQDAVNVLQKDWNETVEKTLKVLSLIRSEDEGVN